MLQLTKISIFPAVAAFCLITQLSAQKPAQRRILILDFVNQKHDAATNFLIQSIPNAFMKPLEKTNAFEILDPQQGRAQAAALNISPDKLYDISTAVQLGKDLRADIVITGNFIVIQNKIQIQAQAIEISSGSVRVSESEIAEADSRLFESINALTERMSAKIKTELTTPPPTVSRLQPSRRNKDFGTMVGLTLLAPGAGHLYANQWRGGIYLSLAAVSAAGLLFGHFFYTSNYNAYQSAVADFDTFYNKAQDWKKVRAYSSYVLLATYAVALLDILLTGQDIRKSLVSTYRQPAVNAVQIFFAGPAEHTLHEAAAGAGILKYF